MVGQDLQPEETEHALHYIHCKSPVLKPMGILTKYNEVPTYFRYLRQSSYFHYNFLFRAIQNCKRAFLMMVPFLSSSNSCMSNYISHIFDLTSLSLFLRQLHKYMSCHISFALKNFELLFQHCAGHFDHDSWIYSVFKLTTAPGLGISHRLLNLPRKLFIAIFDDITSVGDDNDDYEFPSFFSFPLMTRHARRDLLPTELSVWG